MTPPLLPTACPGCGKSHESDNIYKSLAWAAHARALTLGGLPDGVVVASDVQVGITVYFDGAKAIEEGEHARASLAEIAEWHQTIGREVHAKGEGPYYIDATSRTGRRRDEDIESIQSRTLDCDGGGDWLRLINAFERAGLGSVFTRSSSHSAESPRWHALILYSAPIAPTDKDEWRRRDAWLIGFCSALAGFPGVGSAGKAAPACGLDLKSKTGYGTPVFAATLRTPDSCVAEVRLVPGGSLDFEAFLRATGYFEARRVILALEGEDQKSSRPRRTASEAGNPSASLVALPEFVRAAAIEWATSHGKTYATCFDRNSAAFAIGGALGRRGVAHGVARDLVHALAVAGGLTDAAARALTAATSAKNALEGTQKTKGLPALQKILENPEGNALVDGLRDLIDVLAPDTRADEGAALELLRPRPLPLVTHDEHQVWLRDALQAPPEKAYLDRFPTGMGKSHAIANVIADLYGRRRGDAHGTGSPGSGKGKLLIVCATHLDADRMQTELDRAALERGVHLDVGRVPRLSCPEGREAEYEAVAEAGHSPVDVVCRSCPRFTGPRRDRSYALCQSVTQRREGWDHEVVLAPHAHLSRPGFWAGHGADLKCVVIEEDANNSLVVPADVTRKDVERFRLVLQRAAGWLEEDARNAAPSSKQELALRRCEFTSFMTTVMPALDALDGVLALTGVIELPVLEQAILVDRETQRLLTRAAQAVGKGNMPKNLLPVLVFLSEVRLAGGPRLGVVEHGCDGGTFHISIPRPVPLDRRVVALDATGDSDLLQLVLGRPVEVLQSAATPDRVKIMQLSDRSWSRKQLIRADDSAAQIAEAARAIAAIARRCGANRISLVSYKALLNPTGEAKLVAAVQKLLPEVAITLRWFGDLRGANDLGDADVLVILGTPRTPRHVVQLRAMTMGCTNVDELQQDPEWLNVAGTWQWTYAGSTMRRASHQLIAAELVQAVGRGARGGKGPPGGVWLFSSHPLDGYAADPVLVTTVAGACLDEEAAPLWYRARALFVERPDAGHGVVRQRLGCTERAARRLLRAVRCPHLPVAGADSAQAATAISDGQGVRGRYGHQEEALLVRVPAAYTPPRTLDEVRSRCHSSGLSRHVGISCSALLRRLLLARAPTSGSGHGRRGQAHVRA